MDVLAVSMCAPRGLAFRKKSKRNNNKTKKVCMNVTDCRKDANRSSLNG